MPVRHHSGIWIHDGMWGVGDSRKIVEVIHNDEYRLDNFQNVNTVVDIGAHIGCFALAARRRWPEASIVCIEPLRHNVDVLSLNCDEKMKIIHGALSKDRLVKVYCDESSKCSWEASCDSEAFQQLDCVMVDGVTSIKSFGNLDLVKFDCEGAERWFVNSDELADVKNIVVEWHYHVRDQLAHSIELLERSGWTITQFADDGHQVLFSGHNTSWD